MDPKTEDVLFRLKEVRKWQEEQRRSFVENQEDKQRRLNAEQEELIQLLGLSRGEISLALHNSSSHEDADFSDDDNCNEGPKANTSMETAAARLNNDDIPVVNLNTTPLDTPLKGLDLSNIEIEEAETAPPKARVKSRPFLRRGEGLTKRFQVHPDTFRIENLPKYKYAQRHSMPARPKKAVLSPEKGSKKGRRKSMTGASSFAESVRKSPEKSKYAFKSARKLQLQPPSPEIKPKSAPKKIVEEASKEKVPEMPPSASSLPEKFTWADVLNSKTATDEPIEVSKIRAQFSLLDESAKERLTKFQTELDDLNLFELLEKAAQSKSIDSLKASLGKKKLEVSESPVIDQKTVERLKHLSPSPEAVLNEETTEEESSEDDEDKEGRVRFSENVFINAIDSEAETVLSVDMESLDLSKTSTPNDKTAFAAFKAKLLGKNKASPPLHESKVKPKDASAEDTTLTTSMEGMKRELAAKSELLKTRLKDLETEVDFFKRENAALIKQKQEHAMEKLKLEQDREDLEEKLSDERIRMEVYFHDERMKIQEQQQNIQRRVKELQKPNKREKEEITKLREQVEKLQAELKARETRHGSGQARLRAQIKILEKESREQLLEIESLKKETRKLETENVRLRRESNTKLLAEINRNIAKLAPQEQPAAEKRSAASKHEVLNRSAKTPVVAKVISHRPPKRSQSVPDLADESDGTCSEVSLGSSEGDEESSPSSAYFPSSGREKDKTTSKRSILKGQRASAEDLTRSSDIGQELKREIVNPDGSRDVWYPNGNIKKISADGLSIRMLYYNKDIKETNIGDGTVKYYYAENNTWHTAYADGLEILEFANGQVEHRHKDGRNEIHYPNGSIRFTNPALKDITEEIRYPDGTSVQVFKNGEKVLSMPNGQREIHNKAHKRREYPDGTVKIVYPDGSQETRYSNGRVRLKDKDGKLIDSAAGR